MSILYKYYGFQAGLSAIENLTLGFRKPRNFNDIFETKIWRFQEFEQIKFSDKGHNDPFLDELGVLSLSTTAFDPLMWAHYGENHEGFVVGYDLQCSHLNQHTILPATRGAANYSTPLKVEDAVSAYRECINYVYTGGEGELSSNAEAAFHNILLMKQPCWTYECEIRAIKCIQPKTLTAMEWQHRSGNNFESVFQRYAPRKALITVPGLHLYKIEPKDIKEIYFGYRNPLKKREDSAEILPNTSKNAQEYQWKNFHLKIHPDGVSLRAEEQTSPIELYYPSKHVDRITNITSTELRSIAKHINENPNCDPIVVTTYGDGQTEITKKQDLAPGPELASSQA
ncbi:hypothetical protein PsW74_01377 [Pseudovibrio sp. W74]|nr:hypothetical protein PsW74_01377 [Pseudovibrio sp. W74]